MRAGPSYWCGLAASSGVEGRADLVTPPMKRSTSLIALSMERQGYVPGGEKRNGFFGLKLEGTSNKKATNVVSLPMVIWNTIRLVL